MYFILFKQTCILNFSAKSAIKLLVIKLKNDLYVTLFHLGLKNVNQL